ncbi:MAG: hypothetical protein RBT03_07755 [Kiritimatiellia bacterium]|nr:hypothetical protein [Kiritimatiellia bacterium]
MRLTGCMVWAMGLSVMMAQAQETRIIQPSPAYIQQQELSAPAGVSRGDPRPPAAPVTTPMARPPLVPHPRPATASTPSPGGMTPLAVQPSPVRAAAPAAPMAPSPTATMTPLAVQPSPIQPARSAVPPASARPPQGLDRPAAPMTPLPVQPRPVVAPVQPASVAPTVQSAPAPQAEPVYAIPPSTPAMVQPRSPEPTPVPAPQPARVAQPMPVPPVHPTPPPEHVVVFPDSPIPAPAQPVVADVPGTRLNLHDVPAAGDEWESTSDYEWPGLSLGPKIGTTGIGLDVTVGATRFLNLRSGFNYGSFTFSRKWSDVDYDLDVDMISLPLLVDLYPMGGHFRITAGFFIQPDTTADIDATPTTASQIGSHTYEPDVIGTLTGKIEVDSTFTPYLGIGWGNTVGRDRALTLSLDLGVIFQSYDVSLTSDGPGMTAKLDVFREDIKKEEEKIQKDLDDFKVFPVLTLGVGYHF